MAQNPVVTIEMENGSVIKAELYPQVAPNTVNNFISLVKKGFYDGVIFHRVISGFMLQGGDPDGTGMGGPGYSIKGEFTQNGFQNDLKHEPGVLSMARTMMPNSAGSQFFIMHEAAPHLDGAYAAFGKVTEGMDVVNAIAAVPTNYNDRPLETQRMKKLPSFTGGLVGYFSYDYVKYSNPKLKLDAKDEEGFKDVDVMLFDKVIAFDNVKQKIIIMVTVKTDELEKNYETAVQIIKKIAKMIIRGEMKKERPGCLKTEFKPLFQKDEYCRMVEKAKEYIYQGDIFQVVLSNRLEAEYEGSLLNTYRIMRTTNPSPYMFYFSSDDMEVAGASPETLVKLENGVLHTFPLAGTRPRGKDRQEDLALEKDLLADEKECAEHNMLVDLGRNDIGKISKYGTVEVEEYMQVLRYSHVMHIGSTVRGQIRDDKTALDAVEAVLPAGTLSGAPKYRAMEIINELENNKRGIYGGAVGYLDFTGNLDTCIGIRLAYKKNGKVFVRSGAGIVADSIPEKEFQECINKAKAVVEAIKKAQQMAAYEEKENDDDTID